MGRLRTRAAVRLAAVMIVGACGLADAPDAPGAAPAAPGARSPSAAPPGPRPGGVQDPAPKASAVPPEACEPRASLRPRGPLPPPGRMPAGSTMARIVARGRLVAGVNQNAYRMGYRERSSGQLVGFEIDIVRELARALFGDPNRVQFTALTAADRIPMVQRGDVDLVVRSMVMTCRGWGEVSFSTEYYRAYQRVLVPRGSPVAEIEDLAGKRVCSAAGGTSITNVSVLNPQAIPVSAVEVIDCLVMLQQGQIDAVSTSDVLLAAMAAQDPTVVVVGRPFQPQPYGVAIARSAPDLVMFVNGVLERLRADGTWTNAYRRWLSILGPAPAPPDPVYQP